MSGRDRAHRHYVDGRRGYPDIREGPPVHGPPALSHRRRLEDEFEIQMIEYGRLMTDQRTLLEDRLVLQRELAAGKEEIHRLNIIIADIRADKDAYLKELFDKASNIEAELRAAEPLKSEAMKLHTELERQIASKQELSTKVQTLSQELARAQTDNQQITAFRMEVDGLRQEVMRARGAIEYERNGNLEMVERREAMEKNMASMAIEIEKLRSQMANVEGRPWLAGGGYVMKMASPEGTVPSAYVDKYNSHSTAPEKSSMHGATSGSWGSYDKMHLPHR